MLSTDLKQGGSYSFKLIKEQSQNKFFRVKTDDGKNLKYLNLSFNIISHYRMKYNVMLNLFIL